MERMEKGTLINVQNGRGWDQVKVDLQGDGPIELESLSSRGASDFRRVNGELEVGIK